ncbi:MAG TPA: LysM peptidoglycan-binding domain-containing protein, partial [Mycobacteriales bacterium]|nr:LysM peptidoglycan-binding domain-containing protein [Mycobacteriales bacterium]
MRTFPIPSLRAVAVAVALGASLTAAAPGVIKVQRGDTLSELARRHGTTVEALRALNGLGGNNLIIAGRTLRVSRVPVVAAPARATRGRWVEVVHVVRPGDSLIKIARRYGQTPTGVARRNRLPKSRIV